MHAHILLCICKLFSFSPSDEIATEVEYRYQESSAVPAEIELINWTDQNWLKAVFPFQRGKGRNQPPFELLKVLDSDNDWAAAVHRWRGLSSEEQWVER